MRFPAESNATAKTSDATNDRPADTQFMSGLESTQRTLNSHQTLNSHRTLNSFGAWRALSVRLQASDYRFHTISSSEKKTDTKKQMVTVSFNMVKSLLSTVVGWHSIN